MPTISFVLRFPGDRGKAGCMGVTVVLVVITWTAGGTSDLVVRGPNGLTARFQDHGGEAHGGKFGRIPGRSPGRRPPKTSPGKWLAYWVVVVCARFTLLALNAPGAFVTAHTQRRP